MSSYYVKRSSKQNAAGFAYVGPMPLRRAKKEAAVWGLAGESAEILESTKEVRADVRAWEKITHADDAREIVTYKGEQMTLATYRFLVYAGEAA